MQTSETNFDMDSILTDLGARARESAHSLSKASLRWQAHHQHHRIAGQQLRKPPAAQLSHSARRLGLERRIRLMRLARIVRVRATDGEESDRRNRSLPREHCQVDRWKS